MKLTILFFFICFAAQAQLIKFSELPVANTPGGTEIAPIVQSGVNRKISLNQVKAFVWDLTPSITTNDTIGYVLVRRTSDGKVFKRSVSSLFGGGDFLPLTLTGSTIVSGAGNNLTFSGLGVTTISGTGGTTITDTNVTTNASGNIILDASDATLTLNGTTDAATLSTTGGVTVNAGSTIAMTATGTGDITLDANDDIDIDPVDDLLLKGVVGTTGKYIGNNNGSPEWQDPINLFTNSGTLSSERTVGGASTYGLTFSLLTQFHTGSSNSTTFSSDNGNNLIGMYHDLDLLRIVTDNGNDIEIQSDDDLNLEATDLLLTTPLVQLDSLTQLVTRRVSDGKLFYRDVSSITSTGGHVIEDEGTPLTQRTNMNFTGAGVTVTDAGGVTVVTIPAGTSPGGADTQVQYNDGGAFNAEADMAYNETTNTLTVDVVAVDTEIYDATGWNGDLSVATKDAIRDKIETLGGSAHVIEDEGTPLTQRSNMNFTGGGVSVADAGGKTVVTVAGAGTKPWEFNVVDYGAVGNNSTDDTNAFQAAIDAAIQYRNGVLIIPRPSVAYKITSTLNVVPASGVQTRMNLWAPGVPGDISYQGANNTALFYIKGLKDSNWTGLAAAIATGRTGCVIIDIDSDNTVQSTSFNTFMDFYLNLGGDDDAGTAAGRNEDCIGIRTGNCTANCGSGDISNYEFINISVFGGNDQGEATTPCLGQYAYLNTGPNTLSMAWRGGFVNNCDRAYSNINRAGTRRGNGSVFFYAMGCSSNNLDFAFAWEQAYLIDGGRFEVGNQFLQVLGDPGPPSISLKNIVISAYADQDDIIGINYPSFVSMDNIQIIKGSASSYTSVIKLLSTNNFGTLSIQNSSFSLPTTSAHPFEVSGGGAWQITTQDNVRLRSDVFYVHGGSYFPNVSIPGNTLDIDATDVGNVGAGEDVLYTYTLPANMLNTNEQTLHIRAAGSNTANGNNKRLRLKFGATNIVDPGTNGISGTWIFDCEVIRISNTTQKCACAVTALSGTHTVLSDMTSTLSSTVVIQLTGEAVANNDIIKESVKVSMGD